MRVVFAPEAREEILEAAAYYRDRSSRSAEKFGVDIARAIALLAEFPGAGSPISQSARRLLLRKFPYQFIYRVEGESIRVFPLSNWTELDVWQYVHLEQLEIVPLYFAKHRPVVLRNGTLIMVDDDRLPIAPGEQIEMREVRFRTLGCYPLTGAIESSAKTLPEIIREMLLTRHSERQNRVIDHDAPSSMEQKKREGYF